MILVINIWSELHWNIASLRSNLCLSLCFFLCLRTAFICVNYIHTFYLSQTCCHYFTGLHLPHDTSSDGSRIFMIITICKGSHWDYYILAKPFVSADDFQEADLCFSKSMVLVQLNGNSPVNSVQNDLMCNQSQSCSQVSSCTGTLCVSAQSYSSAVFRRKLRALGEVGYIMFESVWLHKVWSVFSFQYKIIYVLLYFKKMCHFDID